MRYSGFWIAVATFALCAGLGTREATAQQNTNIGNTRGDTGLATDGTHQRYSFPGERTITHDSVERKLDYRDINIAQPEDSDVARVAAGEDAHETDTSGRAWWKRPFRRRAPAEHEPEPVADEGTAWWKRPFRRRAAPAAAPVRAAPAKVEEPAAEQKPRRAWWRMRRVPEDEMEATRAPKRTMRGPTAGSEQGHQRFEHPGSREITHRSAARQLDYEQQGIASRVDTEPRQPRRRRARGAAPSAVENVPDWGRSTTYGQYRGRRTNGWRELALSGEPTAYDQLIAALQYYPSHKPPNNIRTRRDVAEALGVLRDPRAIQALEDALNDPDFLVRQYAAQSLAILREYAE